MKNVTLAFEEGLLGEARALAKQRQTTLNAMIRSLVAREVAQEGRIAAAKQGMLELIERSTLEFEPGADLKELSRGRGTDQLSGHEHSDPGSRKKAG